MVMSAGTLANPFCKYKLKRLNKKIFLIYFKDYCPFILG